MIIKDVIYLHCQVNTLGHILPTESLDHHVLLTEKILLDFVFVYDLHVYLFYLKLLIRLGTLCETPNIF